MKLSVGKSVEIKKFLEGGVGKNLLAALGVLQGRTGECLSLFVGAGLGLVGDGLAVLSDNNITVGVNLGLESLHAVALGVKTGSGNVVANTLGDSGAANASANRDAEEGAKVGRPLDFTHDARTLVAGGVSLALALGLGNTANVGLDDAEFLVGGLEELYTNTAGATLGAGLVLAKLFNLGLEGTPGIF